MQWVDIKDRRPVDTSKKYVIETRTMMGNIHRVETTWNGKTFGVTNQVVLRWLEE